MNNDSYADGKNILLHMTTEVVAAYVSRNEIDPADLPNLIRSAYGALSSIQSNPGPNGNFVIGDQKPAVPIKKSITNDFIICLEDGKKLKMLKRHIRTAYGMSPEVYRAKWGLPPDYPMVASNYAKQRSVFAKKIGLGRGATGRKRRKFR
ncbi:MAG: MucR family transcriptional regulator [Alphaproteobacteria bacterium]